MQERPSLKCRVAHAVTTIGLLGYSLLPILWLALTAFKSRTAIVASPPVFFFSPTLENIASEYYGQSLSALITNAFIIASVSALATVAISAPAGYYFARVRGIFAEQAFLFVLSSRIMSPLALSLPYLAFFSIIQLRGGYGAIILCHIAANIPLTVWLCERYFARLDERIEYAARLDGAGAAQTFVQVVLPLSRPVLALALLLAFILSWNEMMMSSILTAASTRPITTFLPVFVMQGVTQWAKFSFVAVLSMIPVFLAIALMLRVTSLISPAFLTSSKE